MKSLNLFEGSTTGEKVTDWTVYSVAKLVFIQQVRTGATQKHPWPEDGTKGLMARTRLHNAGLKYREIQ